MLRRGPGQADPRLGDRRLPQDGRFKVRIAGKEVDLRIATIPILYGESLVIRLLERRVVQIDALIDQAIARDVAKQRNRQILESAPSVGPGIARTLLVDLPELGHLDRKQIASLCGLAPFARDSGRKRGQRSIRAGRTSPRTALYLGAMNAARFNPTLKLLYQRLRAAGKPAKLAFIAVARKLLTILNAMIRDQKTWELRSA